MTWEQINNWFNSFYEEYIENKKAVRGRTFSGSHIEIWSENDIVIVLHDPYLRGSNLEEKALDFVRAAKNNDVMSLYAEFKYDRFKKIVSGEEPLTENDWVWHDEYIA